MQNRFATPELFGRRPTQLLPSSARGHVPSPDTAQAFRSHRDQPPVRIRPYRSSDRPQIREIAWSTGDMGHPASRYWGHRNSFADLWTSYYTDDEPEHLLVAELEGQVVGYLAGCIDSRQAPDPSVLFLKQVLRHGLWLRPGTAGFCWRALKDVLLTRSPPLHDLTDLRWPAHLHIDLLPGSRGHGVGRQLMARWLKSLRAHHVAGCHLITLAENQSAIGFFIRSGFRPYGAQRLVPGLRAPDGTRLHAMTMVIDLWRADSPVSCKRRIGTS